jgi:hypothetical protein
MRDYAGLRRKLLLDLEPYLTGNPFMSSDMNGQQLSALALTDSFYKKLCPNDSSPEAEANALKKFLAINNRISDEPFEFPVNHETDSVFWDYFKNSFQEAVSFEIEGDNYDLAFITESLNVGPGTAQKASNTDFVSKIFEGPVSYTSEHLIPLYRSALASTSLWADAEHLRSSRYPFVKVKGGRVFFAKKNAEISRTCCTPANLNLMFQMSCGAFLENRLLKYFGVSLSTQPDKNRELARIGSIDGSFGTIDLVSASDSVSFQLFLKIMPDCFLKYVMLQSRDELAVLPDGSEVGLRMMSTMGNGYTFPLQTLIFASAVKAVYEMMGMRPSAASSCHPSRTRYGVFGDDIIVCREAYSFLVKMLTKLGFEVNEAKSFNTGSFRESCGSDFYLGRNVRGVYIQSLETPQQIYSAVNRLTRWSSRNGVPLQNLLRELRGLVRTVLVPPSASDDSGIKVPFRATTPRVDNRYWFRYRYYKRLARDVVVTTTYPGEVTWEPDGEEGTSRPGHRKVARIDKIPFSSPEFLNEFGLGVGVLGGYIRQRDLSLTEMNVDDYLMGNLPVSSKISRRDPSGARPRYRLMTDSIPYWDWPGQTNPWGPCSDTEFLQFHSQWELTVMASLHS